MKYYSRGFTLIEIMIVIGIIGFFALVVVSGSLRDSKDKARIARAEIQLQDIYTAMRLYREDLNQMPPGANTCSYCAYREGEGVNGHASSDWTSVIDALHPEYLSSRMDRDAWGNYYAYDNNYKFGASASSFAAVFSADSDIEESDGIPSVLCSLGPDGILQTGSVPSDPPDGDGPDETATGYGNDPYMQTGTYGAEGDDICIFIYDND